MTPMSDLPEAHPDIPPGRRRVFDTLRWLAAEHDRPPLREEIASHLGLRRWTVQRHLDLLKAAGLVDWIPHTPRSLETTTDPDLLAAYGFDPSPGRNDRGASEPGATVYGLPDLSPTTLPVLGRAAAGLPVTAGTVRYSDGQDVIELPPELAGTAQYAVRVEGTSVEGRRLFDGDYALVDQRQPAREDDMVAVIVLDEQTGDVKANIKIFANRDGEAYLLSANSAFPPIPAAGARILGRVTTVVRRL
jgi:repressor LexA